MENTRQPKWDWDSYFPRMLDLYNKGLTIPQIHEAIQCENFKPCQRAVYDRFKKAGLSTGYDRWPEFQCAGSSTDSATGDSATLPQNITLSRSGGDVPRPEICIPLQGGMHIAPSSVVSSPSIASLPDDSVYGDGFGSPAGSLLPYERVCDEILGSHNLFSPTGYADGINLEDPELRSSDSLLSFNFSSDQMSISSLHFSIDEQDAENLRPFSLEGNMQQQYSGGRTRQRSRMKTGFGRTKENLKLRKFRTLLQANTSSPAMEIQSPISNDGDSGYGTGASSTYTASVLSEVDSLADFSSKVICNINHTPQNQHREIQRCSICGFSRIHQLAWVGKYLGLSEFMVELSFMGGSLNTLDAAGNSALHYAAASGTSYAHLKALLDAGVSRHYRNTSNQNFLHCLRPGHVDHGSWEPDCFGVSLLDLLSLVVEPRDFLAQQDNDGQTVLHALALHINKPRDRALIFNTFSQLQFPPINLNRFGQSAKNITPSTYPVFPLGFEALDTIETINNTSAHSFEISEMSGWRTIEEFPRHRRYMDSKTKDTIVHALSRVNEKSRDNVQGQDIIHYLQLFVQQGEKFNWHNRDGHHPLSALVCNQTLARYINHLLWKDPTRRVRNDINIDMMNRRGATALYEAATLAQLDCVQSLIEAKANVNFPLDNDPRNPSILKATLEAQRQAKLKLPSTHIRHQMFNNVIKALEQAGAVPNPTSLQIRGRAE